MDTRAGVGVGSGNEVDATASLAKNSCSLLLLSLCSVWSTI